MMCNVVQAEGHVCVLIGYMDGWIPAILLNVQFPCLWFPLLANDGPFPWTVSVTLRF
jgi:hypothetical protein